MPLAQARAFRFALHLVKGVAKAAPHHFLLSARDFEDPFCRNIHLPSFKNLPLKSVGIWVDFPNDLNYPLACSKTNIYETSGAESGWKRPKTVIRGVDLRSIEDTAVITLLLTRPERKVER